MNQPQSRTKRFDWLAFIIIIIFISALILLVYIYSEMKTEGSKCIQEPFVFGSMKLEEKYNTPVYGSFLIEKEGMVFFNSTGMIGGRKMWDS